MTFQALKKKRKKARVPGCGNQATEANPPLQQKSQREQIL